MFAAHQQEPPAPPPLLNLHLPGFSHSIDVPFPDSKLPVCEACKKNYKTRELCRTRDSHKGLPWNTTYVCISFNQSCIDSNGKLHDQQFTARSIPTHPPYCFKQVVDAALPICGACKEKNYTRQYCREKLRHKQLPWGSVYAVLSPANEGKKGADQKWLYPCEDESEMKASISASETFPSPEGSSLKRKRSPEVGDSPPQHVKKKSDFDVGVAEPLTDANNIFENVVDESRTFLATVSSSTCTFEWLQIDSSVASANQLNDSYIHSEHSAEASEGAYGSQHRPPYYGVSYLPHPHLGYQSIYPGYHQPPAQDRGTWYSHQHSAYMPYGGPPLQRGQYSPHTPGYTYHHPLSVYYPPSGPYDPPPGPHEEVRQPQGPPVLSYGVRSAGVLPPPGYIRQLIPAHSVTSYTGPPGSQQSWQQHPPQQYSSHSYHHSRYGHPPSDGYSPPLPPRAHQHAPSEGYRMPPPDELQSRHHPRDNESRGRMP